MIRVIVVTNVRVFAYVFSLTLDQWSSLAELITPINEAIKKIEEK